MHGTGSTSTTAGPTDTRTRPIELFLRLVIVAGLAIDAYVHFAITSDYDVISGAIELEGAVAIRTPTHVCLDVWGSGRFPVA